MSFHPIALLTANIFLPCFQVLKMMVGKNLSDSQLQQIVDKTIVYLDKDQDGKISFDEFQQLVDKKGALADVTTMMKVEGI